MAWPTAIAMKENNLYQVPLDEISELLDKERLVFQRCKVKLLPKKKRALIMLADFFWPPWILQHSEA